MTDIIYSKERNQYYLKDADGITPVDDVKKTDEGEYIVDYGDGNYVNLEKEYEPSFYDYAQQVVGQGTLMGFGDEIAGTAKGLYEGLTTDKSVGDAINQNIDAERERMAKTEASLGMPATLALQGGGGLITGGLGLGRALAGRGLSAGANALRGAGIGATQGAATGLGMSEGNLLDAEGFRSRLQGGAIGGLAGAAGGALLPTVGRGVANASKAIAGVLPGGAKRQGANVLRSTIPRNQVDNLERKVMADPTSVVADYAGEDALRVAGAALRGVGSGNQAKYIAARQASQDARILPQVAQKLGEKSAASKIDAINKVRKAKAQKNYKNVYESEVPLTKELKAFFKKDIADEAYQMAKKIADREGVVLEKLYTKTDEGEVFAKPTARMLDYMKQGLDAVVDSDFKTSGTLGGTAKTVRDEFRDHLDNLIPSYKEARSSYAGLSAAKEAVENGRKFMRSLGDEASELSGFGKADVAKLGDHELEAFKVGAASLLRDKIKAKGTMADVTKLFDSRSAKEKITALLGKTEATKFRQELRKEAQKARLFAELSGSQTAGREMAKGSLLNIVPELAAGADVGTMALRGIINKVQPQPEAIAQRVSQLLASPKTADKMEAFRILRGGTIQRPVSAIAGYGMPASASLGGYLGGQFGGQLETGQ